MEVRAKSTEFSQLSVDRRVCHRCLTGTLSIQFDKELCRCDFGLMQVDTWSTPAGHPGLLHLLDTRHPLALATGHWAQKKDHCRQCGILTEFFIEILVNVRQNPLSIHG